jgi:hypothetical protein
VSDASHTITVTVDASAGVKSLKDLSNAAKGVGQDLRGLGASNNAFGALASQAQSASSSFSRLSQSMAALSSASRAIGSLSGSGFASLSRGASDAHKHVAQLASAINPLHAGIAALSTLVGGLSLSHFSKAILETGNSVLSFKLALDSVATDSGEANRMFDYIAAASNRMGVSLESNLETFKNLRVSMASLGIDTGRTQALFENFGKAFAALHTSAANVKRGYYDISEVFSLGKLDATRARAIATHVPGFIGALQEALKGKELHAAFRQGIPPETIEEVAKILGRQYASAQEKALEHSAANLNILSNKFTLFKSDVFDKGFDSGLTSFLKEMNTALDGSGLKNFGATVGDGFRKAFAAATIFGKTIIDLREPLAEVLKTLGTFALAVVGIGAVGAAFTLLTSPLGALAALATIVATQWDNLAATFRKAALGAVESYTLIKSLIGGHGWEESKHLAAVAGGDYLKQAGSQAGDNYAESFLARVKNVFASMPGLSLEKYQVEFDRLMKASTPHAFEGSADYQTNNARRDEILLRQAEHAAELSQKLKTLREQLAPTTAAFDHLREVLEKIESMRGKKIGDHAISDSELNRMRDAAKESAFTTAYPGASHIRDLTDNLRIEQEAMRASGGNVDLLKEEKQFLQERLALKRKGVDLTNEESAALRALIHAQTEINKRDGLTAWAESQKSGLESINASIGHGLDTVADSLAKIATEGKNIKATFRDMLKSVASDLIRSGIRSALAEGIKNLGSSGLFGTGVNDSIKAALGMGDSVVSKAQSAVDDAAKSLSTSSITTPLAEVTAQIVNLSGASISGLSSFKPGSSIQDAIRPEGVHGISPSNVSTSPLFSNDNGLASLPGFKDSVKTGGLSSIPSNSSALFGSGINPTQALALPGFKDALKTSADGITRNSIAAFGQGLQKLAPVAERAGLTPISGSLAEMYKRAGLDKATESALRTVNPNMQAVMLRAQELSGTQIRANALMGRRTAEQQHALYAQNRPGHWVTSKDGYNNPSLHQSGNAMDMTFADANGKMRWGKPDEYARFNSYVQQAAKERGVNVEWGGSWSKTKDWDHWQLNGKKAAGIDPTPTGSISKLADQSKRAQQALEAQTAATKKIEDTTKQASTVTQQMSQPLQSFDGGLSKLSQNLTAGVPATESFTSEIEKMIQKLASGLGDGGGEGGLLGGAGELLGGLFEEGGVSTSPVAFGSASASFWHGAPAYAEGTPNTSGGMPAILHPNEAVVPLSRGRSIPVELNGGGDSHTNTQNVVHVHVDGANDYHAFRRSKGQIGSAMMQELSRLHVRNG